MVKNVFNQTSGWRNDEEVVLYPQCFEKHHHSKEEVLKVEARSKIKAIKI